MDAIAHLSTMYDDLFPIKDDLFAHSKWWLFLHEQPESTLSHNDDDLNQHETRDSINETMAVKNRDVMLS